MYLETFDLPIYEEENLIKERMAENGGKYGYVDNIYPCNIFPQKELKGDICISEHLLIQKDLSHLVCFADDIICGTIYSIKFC